MSELNFSGSLRRVEGREFEAALEVLKPGGGGFLIYRRGPVAVVIEDVSREAEGYGLDYETVRAELERAYLEVA